MGISLAYLFFCFCRFLFTIDIYRQSNTLTIDKQQKQQHQQWSMQIINMQNTSFSVVFFRVPIDYLFNLHKKPYKREFFFLRFDSVRLLLLYDYWD